MKGLLVIIFNFMLGYATAVMVTGMMGFDTPIDIGQAVICVMLGIGINLMLIVNGEYENNN